MECGEMNYVTFHITPATGRGKEDRKTILLEQGRETIRGLLYLTSAKKRGGGVKKYPKFENKQYRFCGQRALRLSDRQEGACKI